MKEQVKIYTLADPRTGSIMYVGRTISSLSTKMNMHKLCSKRKNTPRDVWMRDLLSLGMLPVIDIIEYVDISEAPEREEYWIRHYKKVNPQLCNLSLGPGMLGMKHTLEHRNKLLKTQCKSVYQLDFEFNIISLYSSCREASRKLGINDVMINTSARSMGKRSAKGYVWIYKDNYDKWREGEKRTSFERDYSMCNVPVRQYRKSGTYVKSWDSMGAAAQELGIRLEGISKAKCGYRKSYKGYIWISDEGELLYKIPGIIVDSEERFKKTLFYNRSKHIQLVTKCRELGLNYNTVWQRISKMKWSIKRAVSVPTGVANRHRKLK